MPSSSSGSIRRTVSPPSSSTGTRLSRLIYILIGLTTLLCAYYSYRVGKSKQGTSLWNHTSFASRMPAAQEQMGNSNEGRNALIEAHMDGLAEALGIPINELASAIANVVRGDVPSSSLSSTAAAKTREATEAMPLKPGDKDDFTY